MLVVVFIVAVLKQNVFLVLFLLLIEVLAAVWYSISYIPFGRKICLGFARQTGLCMPCFYVSDQFAEATKNSSSNKSASSTGSSMWSGGATSQK
jgi:hypothetical protein